MEKHRKIALARTLRHDATDAERKLWHFLRNRQLGGYRFRRQTPLGQHIADFACVEAKLIVELDGGQHAENVQSDTARTAYLERGGFRVLRFWNDDALLKTEAVLEKILETLQAISPHPNPLPQAGEGERQTPIAVARISGRRTGALKSVASEGRLRDAGAQDAERTRQYVSNPSTAGTQAAERSSFAKCPPLALYIHIPWCVKKCPYCDFNSHGLRAEMPMREYVAALLADLDGDLADFGDALRGQEIASRPVESIFFGGGTPSLFTPDAIAAILDGASSRIPFAHDCEITLETNPGTVEHGRFDGYLAAGVNRISFGVQSFDDEKLRALGRIHSSAEAEAAVKLAQDAGVANINLDLMYALPQQTLAGALADVERALALQPTHLSHYQLTLEPGTPFAKRPPPLPDHDAAWDMQEACQARLAEAGYAQYEVSAYAQQGKRCRHNLNYWEFGDYLGIGAGAHGKISGAVQETQPNLAIRRRWKTRSPLAFMQTAAMHGRIGGEETLGAAQLPFEFMLNALRLNDGVAMDVFATRTGLSPTAIAAPLREARARGWLTDDTDRLQATPLGRRFLNDVIEAFLPTSP